LIAIILGYSSWRWIFLVTGGLGLLWVWWWTQSYFSPENHPALSPAERKQFASPDAASVSPRKPRWIDLLRIRESWGLVSAKFLSDAAWYFFYSGSQNIFTMPADSTSKRWVRLHGFPMLLPELAASWAAGSRVTW
jgi:ACS family hexuronate transporter-like MFS transporter